MNIYKKPEGTLKKIYDNKDINVKWLSVRFKNEEEQKTVTNAMDGEGGLDTYRCAVDICNRNRNSLEENAKRIRAVKNGVLLGFFASTITCASLVLLQDPAFMLTGVGGVISSAVLFDSVSKETDNNMENFELSFVRRLIESEKCNKMKNTKIAQNEDGMQQ